MTFRIIWQETALDDLARAWLSAAHSKRSGITSAAADIERQLRTNPLDRGESRSGIQRVFFSSPLAVLFEVEELSSTVCVVQAWTYYSRSN